MTATRSPQEFLPLNNNPFNQRCKRVLKELKVPANQSRLYGLQLGQWGLRNLEFEGPNKEYLPDLQQQAEIMQAWKLENVQTFLDPRRGRPAGGGLAPAGEPGEHGGETDVPSGAQPTADIPSTRPAVGIVGLSQSSALPFAISMIAQRVACDSFGQALTR